MTPFTWRNCFCDVYAVQHGLVARSYMTEVVRPAIAALEAKVAGLAVSREPWAPFVRRDTEDLTAQTLLAFGLAVQSLWERQLRGYVAGCAEELRLPGVVADARASSWQRVESAFGAARGIALAEFPAYAELRALHLVGNVCRHGDGPSVSRLHALRPGYWACPIRIGIDGEERVVSPSAPAMRLAPDDLCAFTEAIASFWEDVSYIHMESLADKHESVVRRLASLRTTRSWLPSARPLAG